MAVTASGVRARPAPAVVAWPLVALAGAIGVALAAGAVLVIGPAAAAVPVVLLIGWLALRAPRRTFWVALVAAVAIDTAPVGSTATLTLTLWELPPSVLGLMPFKMNPFEVVLAAAFAGSMLQRRTSAQRALPRLTLLVPVVLLAGLGYGISQGGAANLAYHEARGLIFATLAFVLVWRTGGLTPRTLARVSVGATVLLGLAVAYRFAIDLKAGTAGPPMEVWFGHETALFLAGGFLLGVLLTFRASLDRERVLLAAYSALMLAATLMTGRRSGVLVLAVGIVVVALLVFPRRPALLTAVAAVVAVAGALYLNAFWDAQAGPVGEPARAVRSQLDPGERDASSDRYRAIERENIERTLGESPVFGVGFGRPFTEFEPLPDLPFWPLQLYTPHENVLWLWLKTGFIGAVVFLGTWVIALKRCVAAASLRAAPGHVAVEPILLAAVLAMYLAYAHVDLAFVTARAAVPIAVALAIVLMRRWRADEVEGNHAPR